MDHRTAHLADHDLVLGIRPYERHRRHERRAAPLVRHVLQLAEQQQVVGVVVLRRPGPPRRQHARHPVQRVHTDPAVVRDRRQPGRGQGGMRLQQRVPLEGRLRLGRFVVRRYVAEPEHLDPGHDRGQDPPQLLELLLVVRCQENSTHASASCCSFASSAQPEIPSSSRLSSSARSNGAPSAVPCTSMNFPSPVITRFMSVSARTSSS